MKKERAVVLIAFAFFLAFAALFMAVQLVRAFNGPPSGCTPPNCQGAVGVNSSNNLSVGTTTPIANTKFLIVASDTSATNYSLEILQPATTPIFVVENNGYLGIATGSPAYQLDVVGTIRATTLLGNWSGTLTSNNVTNGVFGSCGTCGGGIYSFPSSLGVATSTNGSLPAALSVYGGGYFSGNVGIGTATPGDKLVVNSASGDTRITTQSGGVVISTIAGAGDPGIGTFSNNNLRFITNSATRVTIDTSGNVGIGTSTPGAVLEVKGVQSQLTDIGYNLELWGAPVVVWGDNNNTYGAFMKENFNYLQLGLVNKSGAAYNGLNANSQTVGLEIAPSGAVYTGSNSNTAIGTQSQASIRNTLDNGSGNMTVAGTFTEQGTGNSSFAGNVGIGTPNPGTKLHIYAGASGGTSYPNTQLTIENSGRSMIQFLSPSSTDQQGLLFGNDSSNIAGQISYAPNTGQFGFYTGGLTRMVINSNGNVGIGTTAPADVLDVTGGLRISTKAFTAPTGGVGLELSYRTGNDAAFITSYSRASSAYKDLTIAGQDLYFNAGSGGAEQMRIASSGNVGIGTTAPFAGSKLDVEGGTLASGGAFVSTVASQTTVSTSSYAQIYWNSGWYISSPNSSYSTVIPTGNVGIGTTAPGNPLDVVGTQYNNGIRVTAGAGGAGLIAKDTDTGGHEWDIVSTGSSNGGGAGNLGFYDATAGSYYVYFKNNGNVGIGTTAPSQKLEVVGNVSSSALCLGGTCNSTWPSSGGIGGMQVFVTSTLNTSITATFTVPSGVTHIKVNVVGGGGGGGGGGSTLTGSGGGGGGWGFNVFSVTPGTNYTVTVGAGGTFGAVGGTGGNGGTTSFGSLISAGGGGGGQGAGGSPGNGGTAGTNGGIGQGGGFGAGSSSSGAADAGGASGGPYGAYGGWWNGNGGGNVVYGGGGGSGGAISTPAGNGANGIVVVEW